MKEKLEQKGIGDKEYIEFLKRHIIELQEVVQSYERMFKSANKNLRNVLTKENK